MDGMANVSVVCCDESAAKTSRLVEVELDMTGIESRLIKKIEQELEPHFERELHNAAHHETHGAVTYLQQVHEGGFYVFVGPPDCLKDHYFGAGSLVAFMDDEGPGHGSKVGADGIKRTLRVLRGHLEV